MSMQGELAIVRLSRIVYSGLLIVYPRELRHKFGAEMVEVFEAMMRHTIVERGPTGTISLWGSALWELLAVAVPSRLASNASMAGAISFLASSVLFLVFFRAVS
ncbi:MAG: hypothetical protein WB711_03890 [Terriglobales bacterium]